MYMEWQGRGCRCCGFVSFSGCRSGRSVVWSLGCLFFLRSAGPLSPACRRPSPRCGPLYVEQRPFRPRAGVRVSPSRSARPEAFWQGVGNLQAATWCIMCQRVLYRVIVASHCHSLSYHFRPRFRVPLHGQLHLASFRNIMWASVFGLGRLWHAVCSVWSRDGSAWRG